MTRIATLILTAVRTFIWLGYSRLPADRFAQQANVSGLIRDTSEAGIPGASITAIEEATKALRTTVSSADGGYSIALLPPGWYTIEVRANGFRTVRRTNVKLETGQSARLDFTLQPAGVQESVTVSTEASLLRTDSASVSTGLRD